jgi:6-phosphogluconolactonase
MSARAAIAYVGNADSQDISVVELQPDGNLALLDTTRVPGPSTPGPSLPLAISPDRQRLIAGIRGEPFAAVTFDIDPQSGQLTLVGSGPLFDSMCYLSIDGTGQYLLGASYGGSRVAVNRIGSDGIVAPAQQVIATQPKAHAIVVDAANRYVLHTSLGGDLVHQQRFDAVSGRLTPNTPATAPIAAGSGPRHLVFSPDARFVYVLGELDATVHVLPWDAAAGTLGEAVQVASAVPENFDGEPWAADIHVTPDGRFLYATERASSTIAAFRIDPASGRLTPLGSTPTETQPRGFNIDPSGRYLLAVGQLSDRLSSYAIDQASGALTKVAELPVGKNPNWVEIITLP